MFPAPREGETVSLEVETNVWVAATIILLRIISTNPGTSAYDMTYRLGNGRVWQHRFTPRQIRQDNGALSRQDTPQPRPRSPFAGPPRHDAYPPPYDRDHSHR